MVSQDFRKLVVDMVMATDMVKHTKFMSEFAAFVDQIHAKVIEFRRGAQTGTEELARSLVLTLFA